MTLTLKNIGIALFIMLGFIYALSLLSPAKQVQATGPLVTAIGAATTSTAVAVTTSTRILATTTNNLGTGTSYTRVYADICNPSTTKTVFVSMNNDIGANASSRGGAWIAAGACYEITDRNQYSGSVTASTSDQTSVSVNVIEYVQ